MKRIKLFEAFNNGDKVEKLNHLLLCWGVEEFIKMINPIVDLRGECLNLVNRNFDSFILFEYCDDYKSLNIWCTSELKKFLFSKVKLLDEGHFLEEMRIALVRASVKVIKKMYQDEKNKAI